jgi:hypothetical protein
VDSKYGSAWGGWCSNEVHGSHGVRLLKNIRRGWGELSSRTRSPKFIFGMMFGVRFKLSIHLFPDLFSIACFKDAVLENHLELSSASHQ